MDAYPLPPRTATVSDIADLINYHCGRNKDGGFKKPGMTFLIGSGFSASTGIPTAGSIVEKELRPHPLLSRAPACPAGKSEYAWLMAHLHPAERAKIIREAIKHAEDPKSKRLKINWAHLLLATLVDAGCIRRILTTNFDPLVVDALAMTGQPVRAFDLTASSGFESGALEEGSVVYLHGQAHSLWLSNSDAELARVRTHLNSVFQDALEYSTLVVIGYSGACDPVLEELTDRFQQFRYRLYWVGYKDEAPCGAAMKLISDPIREAFLVTGFDADLFMRELVLEELKLGLPPIVGDTISSVKRTLTRVMPYPQKPGSPPVQDPVKVALSGLDQTTTKSAATPADSAAPAMPRPKARPLAYRIAMAGATNDLTKLDALRVEVEAGKDERLKQQLGDAYLQVMVTLGRRNDFDNALKVADVIERLGTTERNWLFANWGGVLARQAQAKQGEEAERLWKLAGEKCEQALRIKPDMHEALYNWGSVLDGQARAKQGEEAERLWKLAGEKYEQALRIVPNDQSTNFNMACLAGLQGKAGEAIAWLKKWLATKPATPRQKIEADRDFDPIRKDPAFVEFMKTDLDG